MDITIYPQKLNGAVRAIPSKSQAHRLLICAAFSDIPTKLLCSQTNQDIEATCDCLNAMGANITTIEGGYLVQPVTKIPKQAVLPCRESGSTLRFLLPVVGALGIDATFTLKGRLPQRPLSPLWEELARMGVTLSRPTADMIRSAGQLKAGAFTIDGGISSQFISGLLFAAALLPGRSSVTVTGKLESQPYIAMTQAALKQFGVSTDDFCVEGTYPLRSPGELAVEGDWSNGAFFLAANALGSNLTVENLNRASAQGDSAIIQLLSQLEDNCTVSAAQIPDLVPILSVVAAAKKGATFTDISRLRLKESDRVATVAAMLQSLGCRTDISQNTLTVYPGHFRSCTIDAAGDHRIAMAGAIAATAADGPVTICGAQCVSKSYPAFWDTYQALGGHYEQHIR